MCGMLLVKAPRPASSGVFMFFSRMARLSSMRRLMAYMSFARTSVRSVRMRGLALARAEAADVAHQVEELVQ